MTLDHYGYHSNHSHLMLSLVSLSFAIQIHPRNKGDGVSIFFSFCVCSVILTECGMKGSDAARVPVEIR